MILCCLTGKKRVSLVYPECTVVFLDIMGFTKKTRMVGTIKMIDFLNRFFSSLDKLTVKYNCDKYETAGDSYVVVFNSLNADKNHAENAVCFAKRALGIIQTHFDTSMMNDLKIRIGIQTGPVVGGRIGIIKPKLQLVGTTMRRGDQLEASCYGNKMRISSETYKLLSHKTQIQFEKEHVNILDGGLTVTYVYPKIRNSAEKTFGYLRSLSVN